MSPRNDAAAAELKYMHTTYVPYEVSVRTEYVIPHKSYVFTPHSVQLAKHRNGPPKVPTVYRIWPFCTSLSRLYEGESTHAMVDVLLRQVASITAIKRAATRLY
jgi:hypothetical protein